MAAAALTMREAAKAVEDTASNLVGAIRERTLDPEEVNNSDSLLGPPLFPLCVALVRVRV